MSPEFSFGGVAVRDLAAKADGIQRRMRNEGHPVSKKVGRLP